LQNFLSYFTTKIIFNKISETHLPTIIYVDFAVAICKKYFWHTILDCQLIFLLPSMCAEFTFHRQGLCGATISAGLHFPWCLCINCLHQIQTFVISLSFCAQRLKPTASKSPPKSTAERGYSRAAAYYASYIVFDITAELCQGSSVAHIRVCNFRSTDA
jgi:hypothetical protein